MSTSSSSPPRFICPAPGCGRSYIHKEHLTRHSETHSQARSLVCNVCGRRFARTDVLRRHMQKHEEQPQVPAPSNRACDRCHARKSKCKGGPPCNACTDAGVPCEWKRKPLVRQVVGVGPQSSMGEAEVPNGSAMHAANGFGEPDGSLNGIHGDNEEDRTDGQPEEYVPDIVEAMWEAEMPGVLSKAPTPHTPSVARMTQEDTAAGVSSPGFSEASTASLKKLAGTPCPPGMPSLGIHAAKVDRFVDLYFASFHPQWPVIHHPTFQRDLEPWETVCSMLMIGAWVEDSKGSRALAGALHEWLTGILYPRIFGGGPCARSRRTWPLITYQAAFINVVYAMYCGNDDAVSRAILMHSMLLTAFRDIGLFNAENFLVQYEQKTLAAPLQWIKREETKRLSLGFLKADCYLNILRDLPPTLRFQELHFPLPCTDFVWDSNGFQAFHDRYAVERKDREATLISKFVYLEPSLADSSSIEELLAEDCQIGILTMQGTVWDEWQTAALGRAVRGAENMEVSKRWELLKQFLDVWASKLEGLPMSGLPPIEQRRRQTIRYNATMLLHLSALKLYTPPHILGNSPLDGETEAWAHTREARQAIWHAARIYGLGSQSCMRTGPSVSVAPSDPIAHLALLKAAIVVRSWCHFNEMCEICTGAPVPPIESLLDLVNDAHTKAELCAQWVEHSGIAKFAGESFCVCMTKNLVEMFERCLLLESHRWESARRLLPVMAAVREGSFSAMAPI